MIVVVGFGIPALGGTGQGEEPHTQRAKATGTEARTLVPLLVPTPGNHSTNRAIAGNMGRRPASQGISVSVAADESSQSKSTGVGKRAKGLEPSTFSLEG